MQYLEVSGAVRLIYRALGVKGLKVFSFGLVCMIRQKTDMIRNSPQYCKGAMNSHEFLLKLYDSTGDTVWASLARVDFL